MRSIYTIKILTPLALLFVLVLLAASPGVTKIQNINAAPVAAVTPTRQIYLPILVRELESDSVVTPTPTGSQTATPTTPTSPTATPTLVTAPPPSNSPWAMLAANPQRTSWTPEEVRGDLRVEWYHPIEPYIPYKVQPIAANGNLYISTARGLYTFRASDGALLWVHATNLPLGHSPTIATINGTSIAFAPSYDRTIHAINAMNGQNIAGYTPFVAGAGFETNPLVINDSFVANTLFAGNRDGYMYALDAVTGALKWKFRTDGPVQFSAAYDQGKLYFASNDSHAYALNAANGALVWKSKKFTGAGFQSFWPVVYTEKSSQKTFVIFTGSENYRYSDQLYSDPNSWPHLHGLDQNSLFACWPDSCAANSQIVWSQGKDTGANTYWGHDANTIDASPVTNYFEAFPQRHTTFILDAASGNEFTFDANGNGKAEYAPFTWSGITSNGNKYPVVINGIDRVLYQNSIYAQANWISRGDVVGWKWGTSTLSNVATTIGHAVDEPMAFSSGGRLVYWNLCCDREAGAFDVTLARDQPNRFWQYWQYNLKSRAPNYDAMYNDGNPTLSNNQDGWQIYSGKNQSKNGIYGKHGTTQSPPIPYQGKVFVLRGNALLALSPTTANATALPLATIAAGQDNSGGLTRTQVVQQLESEIQKMLAAGPLRPGYHSAGFIDLYGNGRYTTEAEFGEIFDYFQNPADTVYTLLLAYPHLSPATQSQVKTYLQSNYGPGKTYDITRIVHVGWGTGAAREAFQIPPENLAVFGTSGQSPNNPSTQPRCGSCGYWHNFPPFSFYAAWKYAQIVGNNDSNAARLIFNSMASKIEPPPTDTFLQRKPYFMNLYLAGYLGYLRLKQLAGLGSDATVQGYYDHVLALRTNNFSKDTPYWNTDSNQFGLPGLDYNRALSVSRNFMFLTPEVADQLNQRIKPQVQTALDEYGYVAPYWFVAKYDNGVGEATLQHLYDYPALLQARAWALKQPFSELARWLDVPAFARGDLFYIQNLAAALGQ